MASIQKRKNVWQVRIRVRGFPTLTKSFESQRLAKVWATEKENELLRGMYRDTSTVHRTTLSQLIDRYLVEVTPQMKGAHEDTIRLKALQRMPISRHALSSLSPSAIAEHRDRRLESVSAGTVIRELAYVSSIMNHARREWGIAVENPVHLVRKPTAPKGRTRVLSTIERHKLLAALEATGRRSTWTKPIVQLALETAMRRSELLALRWSNVNMDTQIALLPDTKNGESRTVPLSRAAIDILNSLPRCEGDTVFPVKHFSLHAAFKRAVKRSGISDFRFHDLRHTAISSIAEKLPNIIELSAVSGHKSLSMLKRYYHPNPIDLALKLG